jgi:hypothetical protein
MPPQLALVEPFRVYTFFMAGIPAKVTNDVLVFIIYGWYTRNAFKLVVMNRGAIQCQGRKQNI